ncbi:hypothetical protein [Pantoea agglomerans]|jgi:hypothetical protein
MTKKESLVELYNETLLLGKYVELEKHALYPITVLYPHQKVDELSEEELIKLITAMVTNMTSHVC